MLTLRELVDKFALHTFVRSSSLRDPPPDVAKEKSMSSRFLIPALCVGAIALACGPRTHNEASAPGKSGSSFTQSVAVSTPVVKQQGAPRAAKRDPKMPVAAQLYVHAMDSTVRLAFHVTNTGKKRVELNFPSGQTYDFVILDTLGREMWRWGNGRMFTQALRNKSLAGGEALDLEETWKESSLPPGRYTARALLTSENFPLVQQTEFTVTGTTVASR
jgi:hypothetical protein